MSHKELLALYTTSLTSLLSPKSTSPSRFSSDSPRVSGPYSISRTWELCWCWYLWKEGELPSRASLLEERQVGEDWCIWRERALEERLHCHRGPHFWFWLKFPGGANSKKPACQCRRQKRCEFHSRVRKIPWRRTWQLTPVFLSGESHGQRSLAGYSPWGCRVGHDWSDFVHTKLCKPAVWYIYFKSTCPLGFKTM